MMRKEMICGVLGYFCGLLFIWLTPTVTPFTIAEVMVSFIINPVLFFILMICFLLGFIFHSFLIRGAIENTYKLVKYQNVSFVKLLVCYGILLGYIGLFLMGPLQTLILLAFSVIYGIISVDLKKYKVFEVDR